jgi:hypothetical protein
MLELCPARERMVTDSAMQAVSLRVRSRLSPGRRLHTLALTHCEHGEASGEVIHGPRDPG